MPETEGRFIRIHDLMEIVMVCFDNSDDENYQSLSGLVKFLTVYLSSTIKAEVRKEILENEYNISMKQEIGREALGMCNISEGIYARGINKGRMEGRMEGKLEGVAEGINSVINSLIEVCYENGY